MSELYENAVCLAPMVRAGTLPLRLVSLRYGADLVYGEEIVDKRIISTTRVPNPIVNTIDYVTKDGHSVVFRTCEEEKSKVVFQIGTADAVLALKAAEQVADNVAAIDINMGCPKHFSIQGGMGAALLKKPQVACDILKTLRRNLNIPVSCKIRILHEPKATIDLATQLEQAGAVAIGLHARQVHERPVDDAHWEALTPVVDSIKVPILVNGDIFNREDLGRIAQVSGAKSFLIARGALSNASIFRKEGMLDSLEVVKDYLKAAAECDNVFQNTKYTLSRMIPSKKEDPADPIVTIPELGPTKSNAEMFRLWSLEDHLQKYEQIFASRRQQTFAPDQPIVGDGRRYDDEHVMSQQFYCQVCQLQLLSNQDLALHSKGKKHQRRLRSFQPNLAVPRPSSSSKSSSELPAPEQHEDRANKRMRTADPTTATGTATKAEAITLPNDPEPRGSAPNKVVPTKILQKEVECHSDD